MTHTPTPTQSRTQSVAPYRDALALPAPELVRSGDVTVVGDAGSPVLAHRRQEQTAGGWLLGCHGGAGVTSLLRAGLPLGDADRAWPVVGTMGARRAGSTAPVLCVCRSSAAGLHAARRVALEHAAGLAPAGVSLLGLVVVADAPGRLPGPLRSLRDTVSGAFPRCWTVPWLPEWRIGPAVGPLPARPGVRDLATELAALLQLPPGPGPTNGPADNLPDRPPLEETT